MAENGFTFQGSGTVNRVDTFVSKAGKEILTVVVETGGQWPQLVPIKAFGRTAEYVRNLKPGDVVSIKGNLGGRDWQGKVYGDNSASHIEVISKAGQSQQQEMGAKPQSQADDPGSVPF